MNKHINTFNSYKYYDANWDNILSPSVSYIKDTKNVVYDPDVTTDKTVAKAGWVAYNNSGITEYYNPKSSALSSLTVSNVIGIVVIPTSHTEDGTVRVASLDYMSYSTPTTGSSNRQTMYWGGYGVTVPNLTSRTGAVMYITGTSTTTLGGGKFATNYDLSSISGASGWTITTCYNNSEYKYISSNGTNNWNCAPCPYNEDGSKNAVYHTYTNSILSQGLCGADNTDKIMAAVDHEGAITNSYDAGHYPAAECCRAYKDGSWYLPSQAELGYLCAKIKDVDYARIALGRNSLTGTWYWSSS